MNAELYLFDDIFLYMYNFTFVNVKLFILSGLIAEAKCIIIFSLFAFHLSFSQELISFVFREAMKNKVYIFMLFANTSKAFSLYGTKLRDFRFSNVLQLIAAEFLP